MHCRPPTSVVVRPCNTFICVFEEVAIGSGPGLPKSSPASFAVLISADSLEVLGDLGSTSYGSTFFEEEWINGDRAESMYPSSPHRISRCKFAASGIFDSFYFLEIWEYGFLKMYDCVFRVFYVLILVRNTFRG